MLKIFLSMIMAVCCVVSVDAKQNKDEVKVPAKVSGGASRDALQTSNKNNKGGVEFSERLKKLSDTELERRIALVEKMIKAHPEGASSNGKARKLYRQLESTRTALLNEQSRRRSSFFRDHWRKILLVLFVLLFKVVEKVLGWIKKGRHQNEGNAEEGNLIGDSVKHCPSCDSANANDAIFCMECGQKIPKETTVGVSGAVEYKKISDENKTVTRYCQQCGNEVSNEHIFCSHCGFKCQ